ncbi:MAG: hypothetical protein Q8P13_05315 [bacterium]|nr:hypothetical protein [bacterium]
MELEFDANAKLNQILEKIQKSDEEKIELRIVENSMVLENAINKEIIKRFAAEAGKSVNFGDAPSPATLKPEVTPAPKEEDLGFVEGQDVASLAGQFPIEAPVAALAPQIDAVPESEKPKGKLPKFPSLNRISKRWLFLGGGVVSLVVAAFIFLWTLPSAEVTLTYRTSTKDATAEITAVVGGSGEAETLAATGEEVVKSDTESAKATGTKTVGTAAKGRVTIYNSTTSDRLFVKGTAITPTTGSITFVTEEDVTAEGSAGFGAPPKQTGVNVTAAKTGAEGNYAADTNFKVGSADPGEVYAKNDTAFSGGTTKTLAIISDADRKALRASLLKKLTKKATDEIKTKNPDLILVSGSVETTVSKETYDKNIGEEAAEVSLNMEVATNAIFIKEADVISILSQGLDISENLKVDEENSEVEAKIAKKDGDSYQIDGKIKASLIPNLDLNKVKKDLARKRLSAANKYLDSLEGFKDHSIKITPNFYGRVGFLPFSASKIKVSLEKEE